MSQTTEKEIFLYVKSLKYTINVTLYAHILI